MTEVLSANYRLLLGGKLLASSLPGAWQEVEKRTAANLEISSEAASYENPGRSPSNSPITDLALKAQHKERPAIVDFRGYRQQTTPALDPRFQR